MYPGSYITSISSFILLDLFFKSSHPPFRLSLFINLHSDFPSRNRRGVGTEYNSSICEVTYRLSLPRIWDEGRVFSVEKFTKRCGCLRHYIFLTIPYKSVSDPTSIVRFRMIQVFFIGLKVHEIHLEIFFRLYKSFV